MQTTNGAWDFVNGNRAGEHVDQVTVWISRRTDRAARLPRRADRSAARLRGLLAGPDPLACNVLFDLDRLRRRALHLEIGSTGKRFRGPAHLAAPPQRGILAGTRPFPSRFEP